MDVGCVKVKVRTIGKGSFMVEERNLYLTQSMTRRRPARSMSLRVLTRSQVAFLLRLSLAIVFFWFGVLKLVGVSPVIDLLRDSVPFLANSPYIELLGAAEIVIAIGLIINRWSGYAAALMILHLFGTLSLVLISPRLVFEPVFPVLTMQGEIST